MERRRFLRTLSTGAALGLAGCSEDPAIQEGKYASTPQSTCGSAERLDNAARPIVTAGETEYVISLSRDASATVETAASELQTYIQRVTESQLQIEYESQSSQQIALFVDPSLSSCANISNQDAFTVNADGKALQIAGATPRAVLYGAYDVLENDAGIRWVSPGANGEHIPTTDSLMITPLGGVAAPDFRYRIAGNFHSPGYVLWAVRNKLHIPRWPIEDDWPKVHNRSHDLVSRHGGYVTAPTTHIFNDVLPPSKYREEHPEWYSDNQLDITNDAVRDMYVKYIRDFFDANPGAEMFPVTPNDGYGWPDTASPEADLDAQSAAGHPTRINHHKSVSEAYFRFVSALAERLQDTHPDKKLYAIAYVNYVYPPVTFSELPENVIVSVCHYTPADYAHPIGSNITSESQEFASILKEWATKAANRWMYTYTVKYALDALPQPIAYRLGKDIEFLYQQGYTGLYSQGAEERWGQYGPHFYVMAKKLWDHSRSVDALLTEYFEAMAGNGANEARAAYDTLARAMQDVPHKVNRHPLREARSYLTPQVLSAANRNYRVAAKKATTERSRENILAMRLPLIYARDYFQMRDSLVTYEDSGNLSALRQALKSWNRIQELVAANQDVDSLPSTLIAADGYFTLRRYFKPYMKEIDTSGNRWTVA